MEVEIPTDDSIVNNNNTTTTAKHLDQDVVKPTNEGHSSGSLNSDMSCHDEDEDEDDYDDGDDGDMVEYEDDDDDDCDYYMFENSKEDDEAHYSNMQAQFDNVDLPPGVEASFSWLNDPAPVTASTKLIDPPAEHHNHQIPYTPTDIASTSSNIASTSAGKNQDEVKKKFEGFKSFDIVDDFSDHHFNNAGFQGQQPPRSWTRKIQDEWKILEKDLPDTIFVRVYESRMDLLRAVIVGPAGTPYHDGLFVFDVHFPPNYPDIPPMVYYYSGGLRLNPNLYDDGKVCLSLLNTWTGHGSEKWMPNNSTMLQVLVSIQALILNDKPFFNEPGYDNMYPGTVGDKKSKSYNEDIFILSLKTMIYTLRRPPKYFEELVVGHFCSRAHVILSACRAYMDGVEVGSTIDGSHLVDKSGSKPFKAAVGRMINGLVANFSRSGATDCDQYRVEN
ncbi:putative ubiquitin-conjugating enzyme E2 38 isoform X1 [Bidens hawaiensis]|uniref:putative ubiquitin-conjugating enzyme E2 38 isoform X1 n=1 Tax=Bidens hawaiensis TaxID=980011 RepID=UPI00404B359E